jgi:hypothetical protein
MYRYITEGGNWSFRQAHLPQISFTLSPINYIFFGLPQRSVTGNKLLLKAATQVPRAGENRNSWNQYRTRTTETSIEQEQLKPVSNRNSWNQYRTGTAVVIVQSRCQNTHFPVAWNRNHYNWLHLKHVLHTYLCRRICSFAGSAPVLTLFFM